MFGAHSVLPSCTTGLPTEATTQTPYGTSSKSSILHCHCIVLDAHSVPPPYTTGLPTEQTPYGTSSKSSIVHCHCTCIMLNAHSISPSCTTGLPTEVPTESPYGPSSNYSIFLITTTLYLVLILYPFMHHRFTN